MQHCLAFSDWTPKSCGYRVRLPSALARLNRSFFSTKHSRFVSNVCKDFLQQPAEWVAALRTTCKSFLVYPLAQVVSDQNRDPSLLLSPSLLYTHPYGTRRNQCLFRLKWIKFCWRRTDHINCGERGILYGQLVWAYVLIMSLSQLVYEWSF